MAILDDQFAKNRSDTIKYQIHSEGLENCRFHVFAFCSNSSHQPNHFGMASHINLTGLHLLIILTEFD